MTLFSPVVKIIASANSPQSENHLWQGKSMSKNQKNIEGFSRRFNEMLDEKGWTDLPDAEVGKKFGKGNTTVWNWKNAVKMPAIDTAIDVAVSLGVCVDWILTGRGPKYPGVPDSDGNGDGIDEPDWHSLPPGLQSDFKAAFRAIANSVAQYTGKVKKTG